MRGQTLLVALFGLLLAAVAAPAHAHEPLWGETPTVFGYGIFHPELRFDYRDSGSLRGGGVRQRMFEQEAMLQYAPSTAINLMIEAPFMESLREQRRAGRRRQVTISGLGDLRLLAKRRFHVEQGDALNIQHSLVYGLKLPTGDSGRRDVTGRRADPHDQPGTGKPGVVLGYAWDRERLNDTIWASLMYERDLGGGFRMGDMLEADLAYGYWLKRANEAKELGFNLAAGLHGEFHADDPLDHGRSAHNGHELLGFQLTPILTKGNHQLRLGVFVPFVHSGPGDHVDFPYEFRFAFETFF